MHTYTAETAAVFIFKGYFSVKGTRAKCLLILLKAFTHGKQIDKKSTERAPWMRWLYCYLCATRKEGEREVEG